jgi:serine/threonine protein kinase
MASEPDTRPTDDEASDECCLVDWSRAADPTIAAAPRRSAQHEASSSGPWPVLGELEGAVIADRYALLALLGAGGQAEVWSALDRRLGDVVALKVLRREFRRDAIARDRLRQEFTTLRSLEHRAIVRAKGFGVDPAAGGFLALELVRGETLAAQLARGARFDRASGLALMIELTDALAMIHDGGLVHRDIKPSNVMITRSDGALVLVDFGMAGPVDLDGVADVGSSDDMLGTPAYLAPECLAGRCEDSARADVWSAGLVLFELATGARMFTGRSASEVFSRVIEGPNPDVIARAGELAPIVRRCLSMRVDERYTDGAALRDALVRLPIADSSAG